MTAKFCYLCTKGVSYGHHCSECRNVICTFPSCLSAHEKNDFASPVYIGKNCGKDAESSGTAEK